MTEKLQINGKDIWVMIEPHTTRQPADDAQEYFTASYFSNDPAGQPGGILFTTPDNKPVTFYSPVAALEYANEKLLGLI